jgi:tRNA uridine 5-carboxymethylaminomethyl modification enzyme
LLLRHDNALRRLYPTAVKLELLNEGEERAAEERLEVEDRALALAHESVIRPDQVNQDLEARGESSIPEPTRIAELVRRPGVRLSRLFQLAGIEVPEDDALWGEVELKYGGYLTRELEAAHRLSQMEDFVLPEEIDYRSLATISYEAREKLDRLRPMSLGQAGRIPGVSPSDLQNLVVEVLRRR